MRYASLAFAFVLSYVVFSIDDIDSIYWISLLDVLKEKTFQRLELKDRFFIYHNG